MSAEREPVLWKVDWLQGGGWMGKAGRGREIREKWGQVDQFYEEK